MQSVHLLAPLLVLVVIDFKQSSKSDVWAAGVTLFTAAVGHHPFGNSPKDTKDIYRGYHRLLGEGTLPREFKEIVGNLPNPIPIKEYLAGTITRNEEVEMSAGKRLQLAHLLENIFVADPAKRVSPEGAANHPFFTLQDNF